MVAAAVGHNKKQGVRKLLMIVLKPTAFMLMVKGLEVMQNRQFTHEEQENLNFEGVLLKKGGMAQFDFMRLIYDERQLQNPS